MNFPIFNTITTLTDDELRTSLEEAKKQLFDLRLKKATRQAFKPHLFKHTKRRISQLLTLQSNRLQTKKGS